MNDTPEVDESVARRVRKLLDKAEGTSNPHEAEAFSRKAAEIAARHRIDPDRLRPDDHADDLAIRAIPLGRGPYVRARLALLIAVADAHDVRVVFERQPVGTVALVAGYTTDLDVVEMLYHSLHQQASAQMSTVRRATGAATQRHRRAFLFGYASRISELLGEAAADARRESTADAAATDETALALRQRAEAVDEFSTQEWGRVRRAKSVTPVEPGGWVDGSAAADRADIGRTRLGGHVALPSGR